MNGGKRRDETSPGETVAFTLRLPAVVDHHFNLEADRQGRSKNALIVEACAAALAPPGGASRIARLRRRLVPRPQQAQAAMAFLLAYTGRVAEARKLWPDGWGKFPGKGTADDLTYAGALVAAEIDSPTLASRVAPSGAR